MGIGTHFGWCGGELLAQRPTLRVGLKVDYKEESLGFVHVPNGVHAPVNARSLIKRDLPHFSVTVARVTHLEQLVAHS